MTPISSSASALPDRAAGHSAARASAKRFGFHQIARLFNIRAGRHSHKQRHDKNRKKSATIAHVLCISCSAGTGATGG